MSEVVRHDDGPVRVLVLNRPERKNAMSPGMLALLAEDLERCGAEGLAVVVGGEGDAFCAGFDMKMVHERRGALGELLVGLSTVVRLMRRHPRPVVVAAHGAAVAGGCALIGGADFAVTDQGARLGYPVVKLGVSPAINGPTLASAVGFGRARERMLDPGLIDGLEARRIGLVQKVCDIREDVLPAAVKVCKRMAVLDAGTFAATKGLLNELEGTDGDGVFEKALAASMGLVDGEDQVTRVAGLWGKAY